MREPKDDAAVAVPLPGRGVEPLPFETGVADWSRDGYVVSTDQSRLCLPAVQRFLMEEASWGRGLTASVIARAVANSLPFGLYTASGELVGFARVVSDGAMFAYLRDVFILEAHRGRGLAKWLVECVCEHPDLVAVRTWLLATPDAHGLYERCGFRRAAHPENFMEKRGRTDAGDDAPVI